MTGHEAVRLAAHATMPEIAPHCPEGHTMTKKRAASGKYYYACLVCQGEKSRVREAKFRVKRKGGHYHGINQNLRWCPNPKCDEPMTFAQPTFSNRHGHWVCYPCNNRQAKAEAAAKIQAGKDAALSVTELAKKHYHKAWANIQRMPKVEVMA